MCCEQDDRVSTIWFRAMLQLWALRGQMCVVGAGRCVLGANGVHSSDAHAVASPLPRHLQCMLRLVRRCGGPVTTHHRPPRSTTIYQLIAAHNYRRIEPVMLGGGKPPISDQSRRSGVGVGGGSQPLFTSLGMGSAASSQAGSGAKIRPLKCFLAFFYRRQMGSPVTCWRTSSGRHGLLGLPLNPPMIGHNDKRR